MGATTAAAGGLRVLHLIDHLGAGGAQVMLADLVLAQRAAGEAIEHRVTVLHGGGAQAERLRQAGVAVDSLAPSRHHLGAVLGGVRRQLRDGGFDLLHLHLEAATLLGAILMPRRRPQPDPGAVPVITTIYSIKAQYRPLTFHLFGLLRPWLDRYVAIFPESRQDLRSVGVPDHRIVEVPIAADTAGADPGRRPQARARLAAAHRLDPAAPLLLTVARLHPDRHNQVLIEGMRHLLERVPGTTLVMVGDGPERPRLEALAAAAGIAARIVFAGARFDVWDLYPAADVYLSEARGDDIGVAALQAMACARPVVAFNRAAMAERWRPARGRGAFLLAADAAALAACASDLLGDPEAASQLGEEARARVLGGAAGSAAAYAALYRDEVALRQRGAS